MLRIVGGRLGGRRIKAPPGRATRPTAERVREGVFNILAHRVELAGARVLDLYAGSGAYGIEALSRGAAHATFVESHRRTAAGIRDNLRLLGLPDSCWEVVAMRAEAYVGTAGAGAAWQVVFVDPPYESEQVARILPALASSPRVAPGAHVVVECAAGRDLPLPPGLEQIQANLYGDTQAALLRKLDSSPYPGA